MNKKSTEQTGIYPILRGLEVGQSHDFSADKLSSVKAICSTMGFQWDKKFSTKIDRAKRTVSVTRIS